MNLRCLYCQTPFTLSRNEMLTALVTMKDKNMNHYDAQCPRCRRANSISRQRMELFFPNWQEAVKNMPPPSPNVTPASASLKTEPLPKSLLKSKLKKSASKADNAATKAKPSASKRKRASKPSAAKKTTPSRPAPRGVKSPAKKKK
jgi:hypothetical protein